MNTKLRISRLGITFFYIVIAFVFCFQSMASSYTEIDASLDVSALSSSFEITELTDEVDKVYTKHLDTSDYQGIDRNEKVTVIVRLNGDALVDRFKTGSYQSVLDYSMSSSGSKHLKSLLLNQASVIDSITKKIDLKIRHNYTAVLNGFSATVRYGDVATLKEVVGVENVIISQQYNVPTALTVDNQVFVHDTGIYDTSGVPFDGSGTVVAIFDTGLDFTHPAFSHMPTTQKLTRERVRDVLPSLISASDGYNANLLADDVFVNEKVPYAYDYADRVPNVYPRDNHGTHVAGIVAGYDTDSYENGERVFTGVAPGAQLAIFKVFSSETFTAESADVLAGLQDALLLGVDVINMSLGSACGFTSEEDLLGTNEIYDSLRDAGISVVVSAGNEGSTASGSAKGSTALVTNPDYGTIGSPGSYPSTLSTASINGVPTEYFVSDDGVVGYLTNPTGQNGKVINFVDELLKNSPMEEIPYVAIPGLGRPENYAGFDVKDKIALVRRGMIDFEDKIKNAYNAKARGIIIYNNVSGGLSMNTGKSAMIPAASIPMDIGELLASKQTGVLTFDKGNKGGPFISEFSSWGATPDLEIKPEITAHGGNIVSSIPGGYETMSGTSMAAPNLSGLITILRQSLKARFNDLSPIELNTLTNRMLMSTATVARSEQDNPYSPRKQGAGLANLKAAAEADAYLYVEGIDKTKISVGDDKQKTGVYNLEFRLKNLASEAKSYVISTETFSEGVTTNEKNTSERAYMFDDAAVSVSSTDAYVNSSKKIITVAGYGDCNITVEIRLTKENKAYIDEKFKNGWFVEGFVRLRPYMQEGLDLSIPWLGFYGDWTVAPMFDVTAYEVSESMRDSSILDADKLKEDVYASRPFAAMQYGEEFYYIGMGEYAYLMEDESQKPLTLEDKAALSEYEGAFGILDYIALGTLRGVKSADITISNDVTGEVIFTKTEYNIRKSAFGGTRTAGGFMVEMNVYDYGLANNTKYNIDVVGRLDYADDGLSTNLNNTYSSSFYIDSDTPKLVSEKTELRIEGTGSSRRYYLDVYTYDNHYLQAMYMSTFHSIENNTLVNETPFSKYLIPVDSKRNSTTKITMELTDKWEEIRYNDGKLYMEVMDYANNVSGWQINIPHKAMESIAFRNPTTVRNLKIGQAIDLKEEIVSTPEDAWKYGLEWSSSDTSVAEVSDGVVLAKAQGDAKITVSTNDKEGNPISAEVNVSVLDEVHDLKLEKITINMTSIRAYHGDEGILRVNLTPFNFLDTDALEWKSSNDRIVDIIPDPLDNTVARYKVLAGTATHVTIRVTHPSSKIAEAYCQISVVPLFESESALLTKYNGKGSIVDGIDGVVSIPSENEYIYIGERAFFGNKSITKVIIPEGIKTIQMNAFTGCESLTEVVLPTTIENIEAEAFMGCTKLRTIRNSKYIKTIMKSAFKGTVIDSIDLENARFIGSSAFEGDENTGAYCSFTSINLVNAVSIGKNAFAYCYNLRELTTIAADIGDSAFGLCYNLTKAVFLNDVSIGASAFYMCRNLMSVEFYGKCLSIGASAFAACESLTEFVLPDGLEFLGAEAFYGCRNLAKVTISKDAGLSVYGSHLFTGTMVGSFIVQAGSAHFTVDDDGILYDISGTKLLLFPDAFSFSGQYTIPSNVEEIGSFAFSGNANIEAVNLSNVRLISIGAFYGCERLASVSFNSNLSIIGDYAFTSSPRLDITNIQDATQLERIGEYAFSSSGRDAVRAELKLPSSIQSIGEGAFNNNLAITKIDMSECLYLKTLPVGMLNDCYNLKQAILPSNIERLLDGVFFDCNQLEGIELPSSIVEIGDMVFYGCSSLYAIILPNGIEEISYQMFAYSGLRSITLPASVTRISESAFEGCEDFEGFLGRGLENITYIGNYAFFQTDMSEFNAPNVVHVGEALFAGIIDSYGTVFENDSISYINIPNAKTVGAYAFQYLPSLVIIELPNLEMLGDGAFYSCRSLRDITFPKIQSIGASVFVETQIEEIILPSALSSVSEGAFSQMYQLKSITANGDKYFSIDGVLFSRLAAGGEQLECYPIMKAGTSYVVPDGTRRIAAYSFSENKALEMVSIARTVLSIGHGAFEDTNIMKYEFLSPIMPTVESYVYYFSDGTSIAWYSNFTSAYGEVEGVVMVRPSNGIGYDFYLNEFFFSDTQIGSAAYFDETLLVIDMIAKLVGDITLDRAEEIQRARYAYDALAASQQPMVSNYSLLLYAEDALQALINANSGNEPTDEPKNSNVEVVIIICIILFAIVGVWLTIIFISNKKKKAE